MKRNILRNLTKHQNLQSNSEILLHIAYFIFRLFVSTLMRYPLTHVVMFSLLFQTGAFFLLLTLQNSSLLFLSLTFFITIILFLATSPSKKTSAINDNISYVSVLTSPVVFTVIQCVLAINAYIMYTNENSYHLIFFLLTSFLISISSLVMYMGSIWILSKIRTISQQPPTT